MTGIREQGRRLRGTSTRQRHRGGAALPAVVITCALAICASTAFAQVRATYLYTLSNFSGSLPYDWARLYVDQERDETYVVYGNLVRIFNASGMEVFSFGEDLTLGQVLDAAVDSNGDILLLSYKDSRSLVTRCNFRGAPVGAIEITDLPEGVTFNPTRMVLRNGLFYFANLNAATVIITGADGKFRERIDLLSLVDSEGRTKEGAELIGFTVDQDGSIYFTVPVLFKVFKLPPDRKMLFFGKPGSSVGKFGILAGIAVDSRGNLLVVDKLKCAIIVFDKAFTLLGEFGYRGTRPENLIVPDAIAVDRRDRVYVTQGRRRGVSVFALAGN